MEISALIAKKCSQVTVIGMERVPFERVLGAKVGMFFQRLHESKGISFLMNSVVSKFIGDESGSVKGVVLKSGKTIPCDAVVIGAGVVPDLSYFKDPSQITITKKLNHTLNVDEFMRVVGNEHEGIFAVGDAVNYPYWFQSNERIHVEHWGVAQDHGKIAALNMLGKKKAIRHIPFFWTSQFGKNLRYAGHALHFDNIQINGVLSLKKPKFVAWYLHEDKVVAAAAIGMDNIISHTAELLAAGKHLAPNQILATLSDFTSSQL
eukprot:TRINITY_DN17911_c0_g1_i1.p1 TRINITY_DN17911_c0_g1~~TRINITY_DN17911_c0_g1_i1.p1  ORF type:complete len:285 (+),score=48.81 TRINITY_DN17911_c0_g1_i1:68-856(+)